MVSLKLYAKNPKNLADELAEQIIHSDYENARLTAIKLHGELMKHMSTRSMKTHKLTELFRKLDYYLRTHSDGINKREFLLSIIGEIKELVKNPTGNPVEVVRDIHDTMIDIVPFTKETIDSLKALLRELSELDEEFEKLGGTRYNYYVMMKKDVEKLQGSLAKLSAGDTKKALDELINNYTNLLVSMQNVLTPPLRIDIEPSRLYKMVEHGVPITEISKATGHSEDELRAMLTQARMEAMEGATSAEE